MSHEGKIKLVQRVEFLTQKCRGKKVLHLGCTNYPFTKEAIETEALLHIELNREAGELFGFDYDPEGIEILKSKGFKNLFQGDLENLAAVSLEEKFDVIIAGEIIEHLSNPGLFLEGIKRFMNGQTELVVTTINAYCGFRFLQYFLRGKGGFQEPVHPDHISYYSYSTLKLILARHGLVIKEFLFYDLGSEHRVHGKWYLNFINDLSVKFTPQLADGLIAVCGLGKKS